MDTKKMMLLALIGGLLFSLTACSKPVNVPLGDVLDEIKEAIRADLIAGGNFSEEDLADGLPGLMEGDILDEDMGIFLSDPQLFDRELLEEGLVLAPMFNVMSDEIILLKAADKKAIKELEVALEQEKENRLKQWETYLPDQHEKVKNTLIKGEGHYLLYATWADPAIIEAAFTKALSNK